MAESAGDKRKLIIQDLTPFPLVTEQIVHIEQMFESPAKERYPVALLEQRLERLKKDHAWLVQEHDMILQKTKEQWE